MSHLDDCPYWAPNNEGLSCTCPDPDPDPDDWYEDGGES